MAERRQPNFNDPALDELAQRREREARALRQNLLRRKAQQRARAEPPSAPLRRPEPEGSAKG